MKNNHLPAMKRNNQRKTILYFLDDPSRDKHFHHYVLSGLEQAGYHPLVTYFWRGRIESSLEKQGHSVLDLGCSRESYKGFHPALIFKVKAAIEVYDAVGAHVQRHHPLIYVALAASLTHLPVLFYTIRSTKLLRTFSRKIAFKSISNQITQIIAVSKGVKEDFIKRSGIPEDRIVVIHNGLDPSDFHTHTNPIQARRRFRLPEKQFIFGMVARLKKAKDHRNLIHAFGSLKAGGMDAQLVLVGDGPLEKELRDLVRALKLEQHVLFLGRLPPSEIPTVLRAFDVFVHPSWREGMPGAILEAMAAGLPVISTDAEGVGEIFKTDSNFGTILPRGKLESLADAMAKLYLCKPQELHQMGQAAQARIKEAFTHRHMVQKTLELYNNYLGNCQEQ